VRNLIASNVSVIGDYVTLNTVTSNTEQMVITNAGTGPGLKVTQTGNESIAEFYDDGGVLVMKVADGGNVGIGTGTPMATLHTAGQNMLIGTSTTYANYTTYGSNLNPPSSDGRINGVNITALNKRTRTSYASAVDCVSAWTNRSSTADIGWKSICWAPELSLFVAVSPSGTGNNGVMSSPDGINWTSRISVADNNWNSVCWAPELSLFVVVAQSGTGNRVMTSPNGITWTARNAAAEIGWHSVCWSPELSLFVAVAIGGVGNRVMTSPNGINWTIQSSAADNAWRSVCWSSELSLFVAVASSGVGNRVMTSSNGTNWTIRESPADNDWMSVCWSPELSLFVAVSNTGTGNRVMTSQNGINWTTRASAVDNGWWAAAWSPQLSMFAAVSDTGTNNRVMTSPDGLNWTTRTTPNNNWYSLCWSPELSIFVAGAWSGAGNRVMTSTIGMPNSKSVVKASPTQMIVDAQGNVGIGTANPQSLLHIVEGGSINLGNGLKTFFTDRGFTAGNLQQGYNSGGITGPTGGIYSYTIGGSDNNATLVVSNFESSIVVGALYQILFTASSASVGVTFRIESPAFTVLYTSPTLTSTLKTYSFYVTLSNPVFIVRVNGGSTKTISWNAFSIQRYDTYLSGSLGIGTTNPLYRLDVNHGALPVALHLTGTGTDSAVIRFNAAASGGKIYHVGSTASGSGAGAGWTIYDVTDNTIRLRVDNKLNVFKAAHSAGTNDAHLELTGDGVDNAKEISLRFHQPGQWWGQIRLRSAGFYFTNGDTDSLRSIYCGALSKTSGTFDIPHPTQPHKKLIHSFIEGPRCDLIYRGSKTLMNGIASVNIDLESTHSPECAMTNGTFSALVANPDIFLQNKTSFDRVRGELVDNILTIICENSQSADCISWMIIGERKDRIIKEWEKTNQDGFLVTEYSMHRI